MRLIPVIVVSLLFLGAGPSDTARDVERAYRFSQRGERALKAGNLDKARGYFQKALEVMPGFSMAHMGLGHVAMQSRQFDAALESYRQAEFGYQEMGDALLELEVDRYSESRTTLVKRQNEVLNLQNMIPRLKTPQQLQMVRSRILSLEDEIRVLEAMPIPTPEAAHEPPARLHFFIGNALINLDRTREAIREYQQCAERSPGFALAHHNLAVSFWKAGELDNARAHLDRAEELGLPVNPELRAQMEMRRP